MQNVLLVNLWFVCRLKVTYAKQLSKIYTILVVNVTVCLLAAAACINKADARTVRLRRNTMADMRL